MGEAFTVARIGGQDARDWVKCGGVTGGVGLAGGGIGRVVGEFDAEEGGLEGVEAEVAADSLVMVFGLHAMDSKDAGFFRKGRVVGGQQAGVAKGSEIFAGKEAVAAEVPDAAGRFAFIGRAEGLSGIFNDEKIVLCRESHDGVHVGHLAKEVDGNNGFGFGRDKTGGVDGIKVETDGADVAENWGGSHPGDTAGGGKKGERGDEDFVAGTDPEGHEGEEDGVGAGGDAEVVRDAGEGDAFLFEGGYVRTHDELAVGEDAFEGGFKFTGKRMVLGVDV